MEEFLKTAIRQVALAVEAGATIFMSDRWRGRRALDSA
jgi:hypothetical protein